MDPAPEPTGIACCFVPFVVFWAYVLFTGLKFYWHDAPAMLRSWAQDNGYPALRHELRRVLRGPFWFSNARIVYRIWVDDATGRTTTGWVGIARPWWPTTKPIEVYWDAARPEPPDPESAPTRGNPLMWDPDLDRDS